MPVNHESVLLVHSLYVHNVDKIAVNLVYSQKKRHDKFSETSCCLSFNINIWNHIVVRTSLINPSSLPEELIRLRGSVMRSVRERKMMRLTLVIFVRTDAIENLRDIEK